MGFFNSQLNVVGGIFITLSCEYKRSKMRRFQCNICGFIYDESVGDPEHGIKAGTLWENIPADWACPECGVTKIDFDMVEI